MKIVCFLMITVLLLAAVGCGASEKGNTAATTTATAVTTVKTTATVPTVGWITADSMRVRSGAGLNYEVIGGITGGERVEILGKSGDWYQIRFGEGTGYVSGQYLSFTAPAAATTTTTVGTFLNTTTGTTATP